MPEDPERTVVRRDRYSGGPAREFLSSMEADGRIFAADLAVDRAHVVMLDEQDIIDRSVAGDILAALAEIEEAGFAALPEAEDVHEAIETRVLDSVGEMGGVMHTARSRNDEVATCIRHRLREDVLALVEALLDLRRTLQTMGQAHVETVMPGYTHLQPAQPITVAHWACSYERAFARDTARLLDLFDRLNHSPLGGAAFAGTPFPIDRERTAELLGFEGTVVNAMDAAAGRDVMAEALGHLAVLAGTVSNLAEDVVLFAHREFVELDDAYASTSSIMPQKKNPDAMELARARAGDATGGFVGLLTTLKGLPRAYNRDLQQATPHVWDTVDAVTDAVRVSTGALGTLEWNEDVLVAAASEGFSTATGVADLLARNGIPFRHAHELVAVAAEEETSDRIDALERASRELLQQDLWTLIDREELESVLTPAGSVASRDSSGGPAPEAMEAQLATIAVSIEEATDRLANRQEHLERAREKLRSEVDARA